MATNWRRYRVVRKEAESSLITSFYFQPVDGQPVAAFKPGQFLTFRFPAGGAEIVRNYSISSTPDETAHYRISVKREPPPPGAPGIPPGIASNHLHDSVAVGDEIDIRNPAGQFFLKEDSTRPVLLLSGGVGLTPMLSMAHRLARQGTRRTWFIHACLDGDVHACRREVEALAARSSNVRHYFCYANPTSRDRATAAFDSEGLLTAEKLQSFLPIDDYECYLCGPTPFMQAMFATLTRLGVAESRIFYEFFGPATVLRAPAAADVAPRSAAAPPPPVVPAAKPADMARPLVTFARSGVSARWDDSCSSILELAEANGLSPEFSCRAGICSSCQCEVKSGSVEYFEELLGELEPGTALICCSKPAGDIVLDI
jgi:ferredoxin-NADP reductase